MGNKMKWEKMKRASAIVTIFAIPSVVYALSVCRVSENDIFVFASKSYMSGRPTFSVHPNRFG